MPAAGWPPATEDAAVVGVEWELQGSKGCKYPDWGFVKLSVIIRCIHLTTHNVHVSGLLSSVDVILWMAITWCTDGELFFCIKFYGKKGYFFTHEDVFSRHVTSGCTVYFTSNVWAGIILSATLLWVMVCYVTGQLLSGIVVFWKLFYHGCLKMCLWLWHRDLGFVTLEVQVSVGWISYPGRWIRHRWFIAWPASLFDLTLPDFFLWVHHKVDVKLSDILWEDHRHLWQ